MAATATSPVITWSGLKDDYELEEVIGEGATAVVQAALYKPLHQKVAIKRINLENCSAGIDEIQKEIQAMYHCRHPNVVNYYTSFVVREELWLVMKLLSCGSALDIIKHQKSEGHVNGIFEESIVASILFEVLKGLEYFHSQGQMHRDLKAGNILVGEDGSIQIADFGVSAWLFEFGDRRKKMRNTFVGTPCWMAPEVMDQSVGYDSKADMWSFGILALELAAGTAPYAKFPPMKILMLTMQEPPPTLETCENLHKQDYSKYSKQFRKMVDCCLKKDPQQRSTAAALLKNGFFKKAKPREYLCEKLVPQAPSFKSRAKAVKRVPGASGRLHRTEDGAWEWSDEECDTSVDTNGSARVSEPAKLTTTNASSCNTSCSELTEDRPAASVSVPQPPFKHTCDRQPVASAGEASTSPVPDATTRSSPQPAAVDGEIRLALRMRNRANKMQDIKFVYVDGKDTPDSLALELVTAGLLHKENQRTVAENIQKFHRMPDAPQKVVFELMELSFTAGGPPPCLPSPSPHTSLEDCSFAAAMQRSGFPDPYSAIPQPAMTSFGVLRDAIDSPVSDVSNDEVFPGLESPAGSALGDSTVVYDADSDVEEEVKMEKMELSTSKWPLGGISEHGLMPPPAQSGTGCPAPALRENRCKGQLQDISNVILGSSFSRKRFCAPVAGFEDFASPLSLSSTSRECRGDFVSPGVVSIAPRCKRARVRRRRDSVSASPFSRPVDESPQSWGFNCRLSRWRRHSTTDASPVGAAGCFNPPTESPFKSTPVKSYPYQLKVRRKSPFVSPAPLTRRHTVTDVSSPFLDKALLSTDCNPGHLIGDMSRPYSLPILPGISNDDRKYINSKTLRDLIDGKYPAVKHYFIIDCRFPYEYEGGHLKGAINHYNHVEAFKFFLEGAKQLLDEDGKAPVLIFHCEFSLHRGPDMYRFIRSTDRERAIERYPQLNYPEMYLLHGGYKNFFSQNYACCEPQSYTPMDDPHFSRQLSEFCGSSHFTFRKGGGGSKLPRRLTLRF